MKELDLLKLQLQSFERIFGPHLLPRCSVLRADNDNNPPIPVKDYDNAD